MNLGHPNDLFCWYILGLSDTNQHFLKAPPLSFVLHTPTVVARLLPIVMNKRYFGFINVKEHFVGCLN